MKSRHWTRCRHRPWVWTAALILGFGTGFAQDTRDPAVVWEHASVYRDEWGTPHVYADNYRALAFAFGYAQAEDHLESMLVAYRVANGRAAEVFGEYFAASDEFALKMGHGRRAREAYPELDPLTHDLCAGFATGVNAWLVEHTDRVPAWADGVRPQDVLALLHCYLMSLAPFDLGGVYHRGPAAVSGNGWAIAPSQSESGETLLVINPHTFYDSPFQWYEAHLACGDLDVAGATLFGLPVLLVGHSRTHGWALTPNQPDFADVYLEPSPASEQRSRAANAPGALSDEQMLQALFLSYSQPYYVRTPNGLEERSVPCVDTPRGPIVGTERGHLCSYLVGGYRDFGGLSQLVSMARATDLGGFQMALGMHQLPCFNVVYADRAGNIFYLYNVKAGNKPDLARPPKPPSEDEPELEPPEDADPPRRIDWSTPVPGDNPVFAWQEIIPVDALPALTNPGSGYVQACGSPPWAATDDPDMKPDQFPQWFAHDRDTFRAQRVRRLLSMGKRSFRDCQAMLYDVVTPLGLEAAPRLVEIADQRQDFVASAHPDLAAGLDALRGWNGVADEASPGMTFFHAWWTAVRGRGLELFKTDDALFAAMKENGPEIQDLSLSAADDAARMMRNEFQSLTVPWGDVHTITRGKRETPLPGAASGEPIFVASDQVFDARKWRVTYGYGFAMAVAFGEKTTAVSMSPFGSSEDPQSPHYADQLDLMEQRRFKVTYFDAEDVQRHAASARGRVLYLRPKGAEAVVTIRSAAPVEARLNAKVDPPADLPKDQVPFALFLETERAPRNAPINTHLEIYVPTVICAGENLAQLAVYAFDANRNWTRLPAQQLNLETRTFQADDDQGPSVYAVLGPSLYRAARLTIAGENEPAPAAQNVPAPLEPKPEVSATPEAEKKESLPAEKASSSKVSTVPQPEKPESPPTEASPADEPPKPKKKARVMWGFPIKRSPKPIAMPDNDKESAIRPPEIEPVLPDPSQAPPDVENGPQAEKSKKEMKKARKEQARAEKKFKARKPIIIKPPGAHTQQNVKRNFNLGPTRSFGNLNATPPKAGKKSF